MCLPLCLKKMRGLIRRNFFASGIITTVASAGLAQTSSGNSADLGQLAEPFRSTQVVDLTHTLTVDFPTGSGGQQLTLERLNARSKDRWNFYRWHIHEHTGTHLDAPLHCSNNDSADRIPAQSLIGPLAVIDIRAKATANPDAELTVEDLKKWESSNGHSPAGGIAAMCSGWNANVLTAKFRNAGIDGKIHTPGFHKKTVHFLL